MLLNRPHSENCKRQRQSKGISWGTTGESEQWRNTVGMRHIISHNIQLHIYIINQYKLIINKYLKYLQHSTKPYSNQTISASAPSAPSGMVFRPHLGPFFRLTQPSGVRPRVNDGHPNGIWGRNSRRAKTRVLFAWATWKRTIQE